jgi:hypothetical protein
MGISRLHGGATFMCFLRRFTIPKWRKCHYSVRWIWQSPRITVPNGITIGAGQLLETIPLLPLYIQHIYITYIYIYILYIYIYILYIYIQYEVSLPYSCWLRRVPWYSHPPSNDRNPYLKPE